MSRPYRLLLVVGARPNFMKIAPIVRELGRFPDRFAPTLVHTGQHYDAAMSEVFFTELGLPRPDVDLGVGSGSHAQQTAAIMAAFEPVVLEKSPDMVLVVGDVNSTIACALVAAKLGVRVAHVEAGLRSFDRTMPEEINRVLTDQISDLLFITESSAAENLRREGVPADRVHFTGNVMIDTLLAHAAEARRREVASRYGVGPRSYAVLTLHRPSNVDQDGTFSGLMGALSEIGRELPIFFPVHPRTRPALQRSPLAAQMIEAGALRLLEPLGYLDFLGLVTESAVVLTDSGGIQEETTVLGVPCVTLRTSTERPVTIASGTNILAGTDPRRIVEAFRTARARSGETRTPQYWDGRAAERIVEILRREADAAAAVAREQNAGATC
jgi:UDP-N-acetylglucosamine 2-epimerase (non-hydrolysing)